jgi:hypothetical protein
MGKTIELMLPPTSHAKFAKDAELRDRLSRSRRARRQRVEEEGRR